MKTRNCGVRALINLFQDHETLISKECIKYVEMDGGITEEKLYLLIRKFRELGVFDYFTTKNIIPVNARPPSTREEYLEREKLLFEGFYLVDRERLKNSKQVSCRGYTVGYYTTPTEKGHAESIRLDQPERVDLIKHMIEKACYFGGFLYGFFT